MAYVAISKDLISRVRQNISYMQKAEIAQTLPDIDKSINLDVSHLFNLGNWGEHHHILAQMPKGWLKKPDSVYLRLSDTAPGDTRNTDARLECKGVMFAYHRPDRDTYYGNSNSKFTLDELNAIPDGTVGKAELLQRFEDTRLRDQIIAKWHKIEVDMVEFLNKCKSLNEAVKLFPGLKMYVSQDDIARMEKKVERAPREALVISLDADGITAAAVAHRLMGAV